MKEKAFFIIFTGLSCKKIKAISVEGESPTLSKIFCGINVICRNICIAKQKFMKMF